jgi:rare lipoprotein A
MFTPSRAILIAFAIVSLQSCATRKPVRAITPSIGARQTGIASWYGHPYHGRATASGEIYDMERATAAHKSFAFGTWVRVDNLDNGKRTEVRINDRGPFKRGRIVDLSRAAARKIDMIGPGTAKVRLTVIAPPLSSSASIPAP